MSTKPIPPCPPSPPKCRPPKPEKIIEIFSSEEIARIEKKIAGMYEYLKDIDINCTTPKCKNKETPKASALCQFCFNIFCKAHRHPEIHFCCIPLPKYKPMKIPLGPLAVRTSFEYKTSFGIAELKLDKRLHRCFGYAPRPQPCAKNICKYYILNAPAPVSSIGSAIGTPSGSPPGSTRNSGL